MPPTDAYAWLKTRSVELAHINAALALLHWDQRTFIPPQGHAGRGEQIAALARIAHERQTDPRVGEMLAAVEGSDFIADERGPEAVNVREWRRAFDKSVRIPERLAVALARAASAGQSAWEQARPANDWDAFKSHLAELLKLSKEKAEAVGYMDEAYDALLDDFEPGETASEIEPVLHNLRDATVTLLDRLKGGTPPPDNVLNRDFPVEDQERLGKAVAARLGYDFGAGRLDTTAHPFSTRIGPGDARITTRYDATHFADSFFGVIHETGHALYSQGQPVEHYGTPRGSSVSLGIHESQSRLWENFVGRSHGFWRYFYPSVQLLFPVLSDVSEADFHRAVNRVEPGLIRVQADEVTYNLHVLLRFELELALFRDQLTVDALPGAWNDAMRDMLGVVPPDHAQGVMQDVHWSAGYFGYFPTYSLGNLYAAQFFATAQGELGNLEAMFSAGEFAPLLAWLNNNIHSQGMRYEAPELVRQVTGHSLDAAYLVNYLNRKFTAVYGL